MRFDIRTLTWLAAVGAAGLAGPALAAEGPRYTYGEVGYQRVDFDNFSQDEDAGYLDGSLALNEQLFLDGGYSFGKVDVSGNDIDITVANAGLGMHIPLNPKVDFVAGIAYVWEEIDPQHFGSQSDDGVGLRGGLRAMVTPKLELNGGATYVDISGNDNTSGYIGVVYSFTDVLAVTGNIDVGDNATAYGVGLRMYFQ